MAEKVILILVDGMRPDGMMECGNPFAQKLIENSTYTLNARTVMPSVTLPCHMSLFHSVDPSEHGVLGNTFVPGERKGLFEQLRDNGKSTSFFYSWGELKDLYNPYALCYGHFVSEEYFPHGKVTELLEENCEHFINEYKPDFAFLLRKLSCGFLFPGHFSLGFPFSGPYNVITANKRRNGYAMPKIENLYGNRTGGVSAGQSHPAKSGAAEKGVSGRGIGGTGAEYPAAWDLAAAFGAAGGSYL